MKYAFHTDPGHGWLFVPVAHLVATGCALAISPYSYISADGAHAWLEEDCDAPTFDRAYELLNGCALAYERIDHRNDAPCRRLRKFDAHQDWRVHAEAIAKRHAKRIEALSRPPPLATYSEAELRERAAAAEALVRKEAERAARNNAPSAAGFVLAGSTREADQLAAHGQQPLF